MVGQRTNQGMVIHSKSTIKTCGGLERLEMQWKLSESEHLNSVLNGRIEVGKDLEKLCQAERLAEKNMHSYIHYVSKKHLLENEK